MARSGSLAYIRPHPGSFDVVGVCEKVPHFEQVLIVCLDLAQVLRVLVVGLALERVRE
jgi:hypothetical protein